MITKVEALISQCHSLDAQVAVFPDAFIGGYPKVAEFNIHADGRSPEGREEFAAYYRQSIVVPGPETLRLGDAARKANLFLTNGIIERESATLYCTVLFFGPNGTPLGKHRKLMSAGVDDQFWGIGDGSTLTVVDSPFGKIGAVACWENYMPLLRAAMHAQGIEIYCAPTADDRDSWVPTMRHSTVEGRCCVPSACQYLRRKDFPSSMQNKLSTSNDDIVLRGGSVIVNPRGEILAGPHFDGEMILTADLNSDEIIRAKLDFDVTGQYGRNDIFNLAVDRRPRRAFDLMWAE